MNEDIMQGKRKESKGAIRKIWSDIAGNELEATKVNPTEITGLIQQKFGHKKDEITNRLNAIISNVSSDLRDCNEDIKQESKKTIENNFTTKHQ